VVRGTTATIWCGALHAGLHACLVGTGNYRDGDEGRIDGEFAVVDSVGGAVKLALSGQLTRPC